MPKFRDQFSPSVRYEGVFDKNILNLFQKTIKNVETIQLKYPENHITALYIMREQSSACQQVHCLHCDTHTNEPTWEKYIYNQNTSVRQQRLFQAGVLKAFRSTMLRGCHSYRGLRRSWSHSWQLSSPRGSSATFGAMKVAPVTLQPWFDAMKVAPVTLQPWELIASIWLPKK